MSEYTGPDWAEIDALPEAEQNERVVRLAVPTAEIIKSFNGAWYVSIDVGMPSDVEVAWASSKEDVLQFARQHPTVAAWESQSRAEWAASKAAERMKTLGITQQDIYETDAPRTGPNGPIYNPAPPQAQPLGDDATSLLRRFVETAKCSRDGEDFRRKSDGILLEAANFLRAPTPQPEVAETLELPENRVWIHEHDIYKRMVEEKVNTGTLLGVRLIAFDAFKIIAALRTRLAEVEAQRVAHDLDWSSEVAQITVAAEQALAAMTAERDDERSARENTIAEFVKMSGCFDQAIVQRNNARAELERLKGEKHTAKLAADRWMEDGNVEDSLAMADFLRGVPLALPSPTAETEKPGGGE